jgi:diguanylate cyclase (GGDEF)-like protein
LNETRSAEQILEQRMAELREGYRARLPERLEEIDRDWEALHRNPGDDDLQRRLHRAVHSLVGSSGTYGFADLSTRARAAEIFLRTLGPLDETTRRAQLPTGDTVRRALMAGLEVAPLPTPNTPAIAPTPGSGLGRIAVIGNPEEHEDLGEALAGFGLSVDTYADLQSFHAAGAPCAARVLDLRAQHEPGQLAVLATLEPEQRSTDPPLIVLGAHDGFALRLAAARAGAAALLTAPVSARALVEQIDLRLRAPRDAPYRVLLVDDDEDLCTLYAETLRAAGVDLRAVSDPSELPALLARFRPELIILDLYMPQCSGLDLARLIRLDRRQLTTPILFLSAERDPETHITAIALGADGFMVKPLSPEVLTRSVLARMQRARLLSTALYRDGLTGLINHARLKEILKIEFQRARRQGEPLCFAMIDLDHFKSVNDRYGHPVGDEVLIRLARLLREALREYDVAARYGGEEVALILPRTDLHQARSVLERVRTAFAALLHGADGTAFSVTLSAGLADAAPHEDMESLIGAADRALYAAKTAGRNRIVSADER